MRPDDFPLILTTREVAGLLRIAPGTFLTRLRLGVYPFERVGRGRELLFRRDDVVAFIAGPAKGPAPLSAAPAPSWDGFTKAGYEASLLKQRGRLLRGRKGG